MSLPDDLDQLAHVHVIRNQELGLVQNRQLLLSLISLNDDLQTGSEAQQTGSEIRSQSGPLLTLLWSCSVCLWCVRGPLERTYGDLVGVLFSDLMDLFAAISCGEQEEHEKFSMKQQKNTRSRINRSRSAPARRHMTSEEQTEHFCWSKDFKKKKLPLLFVSDTTKLQSAPRLHTKDVMAFSHQPLRPQRSHDQPR